MLTMVAVLMATGGCADTSADPVEVHTLPALSERVPITHRAIAAVMLTHLPENTTTQEAQIAHEISPAGQVGAELRYRGGAGEDGDLVRATVTPGASANSCEPSRCVELATDVAGATLQLRWDVGDPEEEPGVVGVLLQRADEYTYVYQGGPLVTGDPRDLELSVTVEDMVAVAEDPWLRLRTSPAAITTGNELEVWGGGEPPTPRRLWVPQTGDGLVTQFANESPAPELWHDPEVSPYQEDFGPGTISGRVRRDPTNETGTETVDILVSRHPPPWLTGNTCRGATYPGSCKVLDDDTYGRYLRLWTPTGEGEVGEVWTVQVRATETVAARLSGGTDVTEKYSKWFDVYTSGVSFEPTRAWGFLADPQVFLYPLPR